MVSKLHSRTGAAALTIVATVLTFCVSVLVAPIRSDALPIGPGAIQQPSSSVVTADALPTVQINGVVWKQLIVGNTVYVAGAFTKARPAGAAAGTQEVTRNNLLAYNLTTGVMIDSFAPSFNAVTRNLAVSPDGSTLYVVGDFTTVNGFGRNRIASINLPDGTLTNNNFDGGQNSSTYAVAATASTVYVGGRFAAAAGSVARSNLAAYNTAGNLTAWNPKADSKVNDMVLSPSGAKVVLVGAFTQVNGANVYGFAAVNSTSGASASWPANQTVSSYGENAAFTAVTSDGTTLVATSYNYHGTGNLEGAVSTDPETGVINWIEDCHGDTYGAFSNAGATYTVGHPHYCGNMNGEPDLNPRQWRRTMAFTRDATGTLAKDTTGYPSHLGQPAPSIINWFPDLTTGSYTGQNQAAWTVTGNDQYVVEGGEFPIVNGVGQQGIVRFAVRPIGKGKSGPRVSGTTGFTPTATSLGGGSVRVAIQSNWDRDSQSLDYKITRNGSTVWTGTRSSYWWSRPMIGFVDTGVPLGTPASYVVTATDPDGNTQVSSTATVTPTATVPLTSFDQEIVGDGATNYWPLNEPSGTVVRDWAGFDDLDASAGVTRSTAGPFSGESASTFSGTTTGLVLGRSSIPAANTVSVSAWIKTTTTSGGRIVGLGNNPSAVSTTSDRMLYMDNSGKVYFGIINDSYAKVTLASTGALNNGSWHQIVGTYGNNTMSLWVDGALIAQRSDVAPANPGYNGWWRLGYDDLVGWTNAPTSDAFKGAIGSVAIFPTILSRGQVQNQYVASGRTLSVPGAPSDAFGKTVFADDPQVYYRMDEASGTVATDAGAYNTPGKYSGTVTYRQPSTVTGPSGTGVKYNGSTTTLASTKSIVNPLSYSEEAWFKTASGTGGQIIGFGAAQTGTSASQDRKVYMLSTGQVAFGVLVGSTKFKITSAASFNDNTWHQVVATQGSDGMKLYVDGRLVASDPTTTAGKYNGYWRIGGDGTAWPGSSTGYLNGVLDEASTYSYVLSATAVARHYAASPGASNISPTASFTYTATQGHVEFDASSSSDPDGSVATYSWNFGDGTTGTGVNPSHDYATSGNKTVTLTVTDNQGAPGTTSKSVPVTLNSAPTAAFSSTTTGLTTSFDGGSSSDPDGTIASYSWNFGDGSPAATGVTTSHTYGGLGTYTVTLTVTDNQGATGSTSKTVAITAATGPFVSDDFSRNYSNGFGDAQIGGTWSVGGTASNYGVTTTNGASLTLAGGNKRLEGWVGAPQNTSDVTETVSIDNLPTQGTTGTPQVYLNVVGRRIDAANAYYAKVIIATNGAVTLRVAAYVNGAEVSPAIAGATVSGLTYTPGTKLNVRVQTSGTSPTTVRARLWVAGSTEPSTWLVTGNDTTAALQAKGLVGTVAQTTGAVGNTITASVTSFVASVPSTSTSTPTASFTATNGAGDTVNFDGTASSSTNGATIASYKWDFGDGSATVTTTGPTTSHTYTAAGSYTPRLTVTDTNGATATTTVSVTVNTAPTAAFTATATSSNVSFDASSSSDPDGTISSYSWDFGDGSAAGTGATTSHVYTDTDPHTVTLTVTDNSGATAQASKVVRQVPPPNAAFIVTGQTGKTVNFDGSSSTPGTPGGSVSYLWNFGDGGTDTTATPSHTYSTSKDYTVTLTVTDDTSGGTDSTSQSVTANVPPTAAFTSSANGLAASFNSSGSSDPDGSALTYTWDFGDGTGTSSVANPTYTYGSPGTYTVKLTVADPLGGTDFVTHDVTVSGPFVSDQFNRTASNGLGTAPVGGPWTTIGTASKFSVTPGAAKFAMTTAGTKLEGDVGPNQTSSDIVATLSMDKVPVGGAAYITVIGRRIDASNYYYAKLTFPVSGSMQIRVGAVIGGTDTTFGAVTTVSGLTYTANTSLTIHVQVFGTATTTVQARVWKTSATEPTTWQASATDATAALQNPGAVGIISYLTGTATNFPTTSLTSFVAQAAP